MMKCTTVICKVIKSVVFLPFGDPNVNSEIYSKAFVLTMFIYLVDGESFLTWFLHLLVTGAPQVLRHTVEREVGVEKGSEALISVQFCSNPTPSKAIWEWGSMKLETGYEMGRFTAHKIIPVGSF